jgi:uncharacterized UPF0160 family protein
MPSGKTPRSCGTHDGAFHADEVTACALLLLTRLIDKDKIVRTRDQEKLNQCEFVCDVGAHYNPAQNQFDHHQVDYTGPMSSAGMILLFLRDKKHISEKEYEYFNSIMISGVDDHDNGRDPQIPGLCTYSHIISTYVPYGPQPTSAEQDAAFFEALDFSLNLLKRYKARFKYIQECRAVVEKVMNEDPFCLRFDRYLPWLDMFFDLGGEKHPAQFVIMPSGKHWKLRGIPPDQKDKMSVRTPLPEEWAGLLDDELKQISGIPGAIFCHKGRFISVWETKDAAEQALEYIRQTKDKK